MLLPEGVFYVSIDFSTNSRTRLLFSFSSGESPLAVFNGPF